MRANPGSVGVGGLAAVLLGVVAASPAGAQDLVLPTDTVIYAEAGSVVELGHVPVDASAAGPLCTWEISATNQSSAHPGNDIIVTSGDDSLILADVESSEGKVSATSGSVYLADEVVVTLRMGADGVFSGGLDLTIRYDSCTTPTTAPPETAPPEEPVPETTVPPTTAAPSTEAPPTTAPDLEPEPLGPEVTEPAQPQGTAAPAPAGPVLPVTGSNTPLPLAAGGISMLAAGALAVFSARRWSQLHQ